VGNNQGQEVEGEAEEGRPGGGVSRLGNIEYVCVHHHDESKKGFATGREISAGLAVETRSARTQKSTELGLLKLGIGVSGSDYAQALLFEDDDWFFFSSTLESLVILRDAYIAFQCLNCTCGQFLPRIQSGRRLLFLTW
jgi:hypothetical protein